VFLAAGQLRRSTTTMRVAFCVLFWAVVGAVHGLTAATLAAALAGNSAHFPAQIIYWAASCLIWLPLVTYAISQSADRRGLLSALAIESRNDASRRRSSLLELADLRSLIVTAIQENIRPVVIEIEHSLDSLSNALDRSRLTDIGRQLADVSDETTRIIEITTGEPRTESPGIAHEPVAPIAAALDYDHTRPVRAALFSSVALLPLVIAVSFSSATVDVAGLESAGLILALVAVLLFAGFVAQRLVRERKRNLRIASALAAYVVVGIAAAAVSIVGPWQPVNHQNLVLAVLLPIAVPVAAVTLSAAAGLGNANLAVVRQIDELHADSARFEELLELDRIGIRSQVAALTHGPLRGRLAACAMALNFHAAEITPSDPARTEHIVTRVREHLADVLEELDSLR
jgi:hypothetical protein